MCENKQKRSHFTATFPDKFNKTMKKTFANIIKNYYQVASASIFPTLT